MSAGIEPILTKDAAAPAAHYSQAVRSGDTVWTAGTIGTDPASGKIVEGFEAQGLQGFCGPAGLQHRGGLGREGVQTKVAELSDLLLTEATLWRCRQGLTPRPALAAGAAQRAAQGVVVLGRRRRARL